ncbi:MAG: RNA polymerase sigma factor [Defluviitaleaceae bacterium]|nr:RNA polymerase sigma factor [Defluviitaleaceae bacterium]
MYIDELSKFIFLIVKDYYETKHLTMEAFARLAASGSAFMKKSTLKTYLFAIGKNLALRYLKMRKKSQHIPYEEALKSLVNEDDEPYSLLERKETNRMVAEAINELKSEHRDVLLYLYFDEMSYIQAGRIMKKSESQIRGLAHRAKESLKRKLESDGFIKR